VRSAALLLPGKGATKRYRCVSIEAAVTVIGVTLLEFAKLRES
jgi:hypothetical protein